MNHWLAYYQMCIHLYYWGRFNGWVDFGDFDLIFKVRVKFKTRIKGACLHVISWTVGWNITKVACLYYLGKINSWLEFGDLDLNIKVIVRFKTQIIVLQHILDTNTLYIEYNPLLKQQNSLTAWCYVKCYFNSQPITTVHRRSWFVFGGGYLFSLKTLLLFFFYWFWLLSYEHEIQLSMLFK